MKNSDIEILDHLVCELNKSKIFEEFSNSLSSKDGRVNAVNGEKIVRENIKKLSWGSLTTPYIYCPDDDGKTRSFLDIEINSIPINIKFTNGKKTSDNANCKLGMYFALTGINPDFCNEASWEEFDQKLKIGLASPTQDVDDKDYVFLVCNSKDKNIWWIGLKELAVITPNGNNLPFQIPWYQNYNRIQRSREDACTFIMHHYKISCEKSGSPWVAFNNHFPEYVGSI